MAIVVQYPGDPRLTAEAAYLAGQGQFAQNRDQFRSGVDQFALNLGQRQSEFDRSYAMDQAKFGYGQFDDARRFGETQRQFDAGYGLDSAKFAYGQFDDTRRFDEGVRQFDQDFGERIRQADIGNEFNAVQFNDSQNRFGANLDLQYDQMGQQAYLEQQQMAFRAQEAEVARQHDTQSRLMALQNGAMQQAEQQRQQQLSQQAMGDWQAIQNFPFRTQEQYQQAVGQWQQKYAALSTPPPIDFGFQQKPTLQDRIVNVKGVDWLMDESGEPIQPLDPRFNMDFQRELKQQENKAKEVQLQQEQQRFQLEQDHDLAAKRAEKFYQDAKMQQDTIAKESANRLKEQQAKIATEQKRQTAIMSYMQSQAAAFQKPPAGSVPGTAPPKITDAQIQVWRETAEKIYAQFGGSDQGGGVVEWNSPSLGTMPAGTYDVRLPSGKVVQWTKRQ